MRVSLHALKRSRLLPGVALAVSIFFLTGQFFACCRLNQDVGAALSRLGSALVATADHSHADADHEASALHHCHGHQAGGHASQSLVLLEPAGSCTLAQKDECLSEHAWSGKPMVQSEIVLGPNLMPPQPVLPEVFRPLPQLFERPRPQNKSSPPLYLTTLRLLV